MPAGSSPACASAGPAIGWASSRSTPPARPRRPPPLLAAGADDALELPAAPELLLARLGRFLDLLEQARLLRASASVDALTRVHNRSHLFDAGRRHYQSARRGDLGLTLAMLGLDLFKSVNDLYGRQVGDLALRHVADLLGRRLRRSDLLVRYGGDQFCLLLVNARRDGLEALLDELRASVADEPLSLLGHRINLTVSIGATCALGASLEDMLDRAELALFRAKAEGRNRVVVEADDG